MASLKGSCNWRVDHEWYTVSLSRIWFLYYHRCHFICMHASVGKLLIKLAQLLQHCFGAFDSVTTCHLDSHERRCDSPCWRKKASVLQPEQPVFMGTKKQKNRSCACNCHHFQPSDVVPSSHLRIVWAPSHWWHQERKVQCPIQRQAEWADLPDVCHLDCWLYTESRQHPLLLERLVCNYTRQELHLWDIRNSHLLEQGSQVLPHLNSIQNPTQNSLLEQSWQGSSWCLEIVQDCLRHYMHSSSTATQCWVVMVSLVWHSVCRVCLSPIAQEKHKFAVADSTDH